jgi:excisionase family DNA binding protein
MSDPVLARLDSIEKALSQGDRPLPFKEAAQYLNCSPSYLYKLTHRRAVPCFKPLGKKLYFKRGDLERFLLQNPIRTRESIEQEAATRASIGRAAA